MDALSDGELVRPARAGDASCLGLLLERHRADMRVVAVGLLGYGAAAEDAVQDAMLIALRSLGGLGDPDAVGAWLRAIVRNECRMQLRRLATMPGWISTTSRAASRRRRYSTGTRCATGSGMRSGRCPSRCRQLASQLVAAAAAAHQDAAALTRRRGDGLRELLRASGEDRLASTVADLTHRHMAMAGWWGSVADGRSLLMHMLRSDDADGVRERVLDVTASTRFMVMECELISPPWEPTHCPPSVLWLVRMRGERIAGIRLYHRVPT